MKRNRPEERLHRQLVAFLRVALPKPWLVFHVPNGGARSKAEAGAFKAMGVLAGMPDLFVVGPRWMPHELVPLGRAKIADIDPRLFEAFQYLPRVIAIELKAPPKPLKRGGVSKAAPRVSPAQRDVIEALGQCGVPTLVVSDMDEAIRALRALGVPLKARTA